VKAAGDALTGVKPPALTAVNPDDWTGRGASTGGVLASAQSSSSLGTHLKQPKRASEAIPLEDLTVSGYATFMGESAGDGVSGPPLEFELRLRARFHEFDVFFIRMKPLLVGILSDVESDDMIFPLYPRSRQSLPTSSACILSRSHLESRPPSSTCKDQAVVCRRMESD
jgi:hypothetical protein